MKKIGFNIVLVAGGVLLGYLLFNGLSDKESVENQEVISEGTWTCSMHPHVNGEENGTCPLCGMDLVYNEDADPILLDDEFRMSENALALVNIETFAVGQKDEEIVSLDLSGIITTNSETDAIQTTLYEGRLDALYANFVGKKVRKGQEIGKIYSPELYLAQDKLLTSASYRETHPKLYDAARYSLGLWKMTDDQIEKMLERGKPMMNFPLYSDVTGTVTELLGAEGNYYDEGTPIFKVSDLNTVWAEFDAFENQLPLLKVGQEITIRLTAFANEEINGTINFIEPILDRDRRIAKVRVVLENRTGLLKPGMFAQGKVASILSKDEEFLTIPNSAVLWTGKRSIVYLKPYKEQPIFRLREVILGKQLNNSYVVLSGLRKGDEIVTQGAFTIDAAAQLAGHSSMMHRGEGMKDEHEEEMKEMKDANSLQPLQITEENKFDDFLSNYFALKDALVETDFEMVKSKSEKLEIVLKDLLRTDSKNQSTWILLEKQLAKLLTSLDIDEARKHFKPFSEQLITVVKEFSVSNETIYVQFCPMADENKGAFWLSLEEDIRNPYFGEKMLICGVVKERIN